MSMKHRIGIGLLVTWVAYLWFLHPSSEAPEINVCSLEYRAAYVELNGSDAGLRRECPYAAWVKAGN